MTALLSALVNGAVAGALVFIAACLAMPAVPRRALNAATRYALWWTVLAVTVALPLAYLPWHRASQPPRAAAHVFAPAVPPPSIQTMVPPPGPPPRHTVARPMPITRAAAVPRFEAPRPMAIAPREPSSRAPLFPLRLAETRWTRCVLLAWLAASLLLLLRLAAGSIALASRSRRARDAAPSLRGRAAAWLAICGAGRRGIRLAASEEIASPVAVGPWRPAILIPARLLDSLDAAELDQIGLHEAAHLGRRDDYALLAQRILEAVFVFHPLVRAIGRRIDLEREIACDDIVLAATGRAGSYATCLTRMVELCGCVRAPLAGAAATGHGSHLARRIDMLLDRRRHTGTRLLRARLAVTMAALAALAWTAARMPAAVAFTQTGRPAPAPIVRHALLPAAAFSAAAAPQPEPAGFEAKVIEDSSGSPLPSAEVRFHKAGQIELAADLDTDGQGFARAATLPAGDYSVEFLKPNFVTATMSLHSPASGLTVRLVRYGIISGQVLDERGQPVPGRIHAPYGRTIGGARVTILTRDEAGHFRKYREAELEDGGRYRIYDLPPGQYALGLWYDGLPDGSGVQLYPNNADPRVFPIAGGEEYNDVDFLVSPRAVFPVSGKVQLPNPKDQYALALGLPDQPLLPIAQTLTEGGGAFHFAKVPAGAYDLFVAGPSRGYGAHDTVLGPNPRFARMRIDVGQNVEGLDIAVSPGRSVNVTLRAHGSDKLPAGCPSSAGVSVDYLEPWGILPIGRAQAAFGKELPIADLAPGKYRLMANGLGDNCYQVGAPLVDLTSGPADTAVIEVAAAGSLHGTLSGAARPGEFAVVLLPGDGAGDARIAFPDSEGHFAFDSLPPGRYRAAARPTAQPKARWVADVARMTAIEIAGGTPTRIELPAPAKGAGQ